ncbi:hypothetical protein ACFWZK_23940 [[Kitasatospora] papulosa]|uniref:hypothetical protein n=1 Tax=[Kitasatospora] papulosa TaxID=1464011 RepID=UPI0036826169
MIQPGRGGQALLFGVAQLTCAGLLLLLPSTSNGVLLPLACVLAVTGLATLVLAAVSQKNGQGR